MPVERNWIPEAPEDVWNELRFLLSEAEEILAEAEGNREATCAALRKRLAATKERFGQLQDGNPASAHVRPALGKLLPYTPSAPRSRDGLLQPNAGRLTSREHEVLQLVAQGSSNKQIATELGISIKTVEKHRQNLMEKLGIHETAGLTRYAIAAGVIENSVELTIVGRARGPLPNPALDWRPSCLASTEPRWTTPAPRSPSSSRSDAI